MWSHPCHHLQHQWDPHEGEEGRDGPRGLLLLDSLPLSLSLFSFSDVTYIFPFFYKRGNTSQHNTRHEHMAKQLNKLSALFNPSTRDLGSAPSLAHL